MNNTRMKNTNGYNQVSAMLDELKSGVPTTVGRLNEMNTALTQVQQSAMAAGKTGNSLGSTFASALGKFGTWALVTNVLMTGSRAMRELVTNVRDLDAAMTELRKVTNETESTYTTFFDTAADRARDVGATMTDTIQATADFARLGYNVDDASKLADAALVYKNVGDEIADISTASQSITSTMQAFGVQADDVMSIVDKFNEVGNNFAISSDGIGEALKRSAAALAEGGNTLDESIALITATNEVVQNPEHVGTTMKTISMYLRAAKTEAEDAGESTDGMADSVSKLRKEILALTGGQVDIQLDEDTYKSTYQIMKELSQVWDQLTDVSQANLLERLGGKRNANVVAALLKNFDTAEEVVKASADSAGSALNENEKYLNSVNGKLQQLSSSFEELSSTFLSSNLMKGLIDGGNSAIQVFTKLVDTIGSIPTALAAFTLARSWINVAKGKQTGVFDILQTPAGTAKKDSVMLFGHTIGEYNKAFKQLKSDIVSVNPIADTVSKTFNGVKGGFRSFFAVKSGVSSTIDAYNQMAKESKSLKDTHSTFQSTLGSNDEMTQKSKKAYDDALSAQKSFIENTKKNNKYLGSELERAFNSSSTASLTGYKNALDSAGKSMVAFQIKSKAAAVGVKALSVAGSVLTAALSGIAIGAVISGITALVTHAERARQAAADAAQEYSQSAASISEYKSEVASINQELASGSLSTEEAHSKRQRLLEIQGELVSQYGAEASSLDLVSSSAEQAAAAFDKLAESQGKAYLDANKEEISKARREMESNYHNETTLSWKDQNGIKRDMAPQVMAALKKSIKGIEGFSFKDVGEGKLRLVVDADTTGAEKGFAQMEANLKNLGYDLSDFYASEFFGSSQTLESVMGGWQDDVSKTISKYGDIYDESVKSKIDSTETYSNLKNSIDSVSAAYDEALTKGYATDRERAEAMNQQLAAVDNLQAALDNTEFGRMDAGVKKYFQDTIDGIRDQVSKEKLKVDIEFDSAEDLDASPAFEDLKRQLEAFKDNAGNISLDQILQVED